MMGYEKDSAEGIMLSLEILGQLANEQASQQGSNKSEQAIRKQRRMRKSNG